MTTSLFSCQNLTNLARKSLNYSASNLSPCRSIFLGRPATMANTKFSYVRNFEMDDKLPSEQWIVISLVNLPNDFTKLFLKNSSSRDNYTELIKTASLNVMSQFKDIKGAYINYNKIHFVLAKDCTLYQRRSYKLLTYFGSCLTASFERSWPKHFSETLKEMPYFDGHIHLFPNDQLFRDYLMKQQLAHHLVNLKQTLHLAIQEYVLKSSGLDCVSDTSSEEIKEAAATASTFLKVPENEKESYYNEVLFANFAINYNNELEAYKKGSFLLRQGVLKASAGDLNKTIDEVPEKRTDFLPDQLEASGDTVQLLGKRAQLRQRQKREKEAANAVKTVSEVVLKIPDFKSDSFWLENGLLKEQTIFNNKSAGLQSYAVGEFLLPHTWIVVRIDGKAFHKLSKEHNFDKPNDIRAINLMNVAAAEVMKKMPDIVFCFGESDEYSFVVDRYSKQAGRHSTSLVSQVVTLFTFSYVNNWSKLFEGTDLKYEPMFDGRAVLYPTNTSLRDYLSWRQADCHINNMYNTVFWRLIQLKNLTNRESEQALQGTFSADKRRIMMEMGIDYDHEPAIHRKGSILYRLPEGEQCFLTETSNILLNTNARTKTSKSSNNGNEGLEKPWWNSECEEVKLQRKIIRKKCQLQPTFANFEELNKCETLAKKVFKSAKQNFSRASNEESSTPPTTSIACSKCCSSSNMMTCNALEHLTEVGGHSRNKLSSTSTSNCQHEGTSDAVVNTENEASLPAGFDKRGNPWWNVNCHIAKMAKNAAKSAFMKSPNAVTDKCYKDAQTTLKAAIKAAKKDYKKQTSSSEQNSVTKTKQTFTNSQQKIPADMRLDTNGVENMEGVVNGFPTDDYKVELEMLASTLREGLSGTPSMPTDVMHSELNGFDHSSSTQVDAAYGDTSSKGLEAHSDDFIKFNNDGDSTQLNVSQTDGGVEETSGVVAKPDRAFLFGDAIIEDSGYTSSSLKEESGAQSNQGDTSSNLKEESGAQSNQGDTSLNLKEESGGQSNQGDTSSSLKQESVGQSSSQRGLVAKQSNDSKQFTMMGDNICLLHVDIIHDHFWNRNAHILGQEKSTVVFDED